MISMILKISTVGHHAGCRFVIPLGDALRRIVVARLRAAAPLRLQVRQADFTPLDLAGAGQRHALGGSLACFHLTHYSLGLPVSVIRYSIISDRAIGGCAIDRVTDWVFFG